MSPSSFTRSGKELQTPVLWVVIAFLIAPWFLNLAAIIIGTREDNIASFSIPALSTIILSAVHALIFLIFVYLSAILTYKVVRQSGRVTPTLVTNAKFAISLEIFIVMISGVMIYLLYSVLENGIIQTSLEYRFNTRKIGFWGYWVLHFLPVLLGLRWGEKPGTVNLILLILLAALNLITGFRILLAYALLMVFILNYQNFAKKKIYTASFVLLIITGLIFYSVLRGSLESGDNQSGDHEIVQLIVGNLARSLPITYLDLIYSSKSTSNIVTFFALIFEPFSIILAKFSLVLADHHPVMWDISEPLVRPFLFWRGTPTVEPSGFSIHIIPFAYLFYGYMGLAMFGMLFGFLSGIGLHLIRSEFTIKRAFGGVLLCTTIMATESFDTMWNLFSNAVIFLTMLALFSRVFFFLFGASTSARKVGPISRAA